MGVAAKFRILTAVLMMPSAGFAAECPIERATFREPETGVEIGFFAASGKNTPVSHGFTMRVGAAQTFDGHVMYDPEIERPIAMAMNNCPEGDVTGATLAACTVWKGIVYGVDKTTGTVDLLPPESADAPDALLLPGFGPALLASPHGSALSVMPWDVFEFKNCAPKT